MEVGWAADVVVRYRRPVRGRCRPLAIEVVLQDRVDRAIGARTDLERTTAGGFEPLAAISFGEPQDADAGAEALLGVGALPQDDLDEGRGVAPDLTGLPLHPLRCPGGIAPMARRHVLAYRRMLAIGGRAHMGRNALAAVEDFDRARSDARPNRLPQQLVRHRVVVLLDLDVVVEADPAFLPFSKNIGLGRQRLEGVALQLLEELAAARTEVPRHAVIDLRDQLGNRRVQCREREELPVA